MDVVKIRKPPRWRRCQFRPRRVAQGVGRCRGDVWRAARGDRGKPGPRPTRGR